MSNRPPRALTDRCCENASTPIDELPADCLLEKFRCVVGAIEISNEPARFQLPLAPDDARGVIRAHTYMQRREYRGEINKRIFAFVLLGFYIAALMILIPVGRDTSSRVTFRASCVDPLTRTISTICVFFSEKCTR